jgi:hypothetical protein
VIGQDDLGEGVRALRRVGPLPFACCAKHRKETILPER